MSQWHNQTTHTSCHIFTDSQAAGKSMIRPRRQSGQSIIKSTLDLIDSMISIHPDYQLTITWIPGHLGIEGNERADQEAKCAATDPSLSGQFNHPRLKSSRIQQIKRTAKEQWQKLQTSNNRIASISRRNYTWNANWTKAL